MVTCVGKEKGIFNGNEWFKVYFLKPIDVRNGDGFAPLTVERRYNGVTSRVAGIPCTKDVYDSISVEECYSESSFLYNGSKKLASLG